MQSSPELYFFDDALKSILAFRMERQTKESKIGQSQLSKANPKHNTKLYQDFESPFQ